MSGISFRIVKPKEKLAAGTSKMLGNPDVWDGFQWPYLEEHGEKYDLIFICQIRCADAVGPGSAGLLPKTGMLYFFYDLNEMPDVSDDRESAQVIWYNGDLSALHEMILTDEDGNGIAFAEQKIDFTPSEAGEEPRFFLAGEIPSEPAYESVRGYRILLSLDSFETEDAEIRFKNDGRLCFYIDPDKLAACDFSDVKAAQTEK